MTSTEFSIGMGDGRNSSKVLKPPGGGSSDIFGHTNDVKETVNLKQGNETKNRLFGGAAEPEPVTPSKPNKVQPAVFANDVQPSPRQGKKKYVHRNPITGEVIEFGSEKKDDKEEETTNGENGALPNGDAPVPDVVDMPPPSVKPTSVRVRQPPGGKSSGIF